MQDIRKKLLTIVVVILMILAALIIALQFYQAEWKKPAKTDLRFTAIDLPFTHKFDAKIMLPFWDPPFLMPMETKMMSCFWAEV